MSHFSRSLLLTTVVALAACTTRLTDFTVLSTKNVDLSRMHEFEPGTRRVQAEDRQSVYIIIPTGSANVKEAVDKAIESEPGAVALVDGVVSSHFVWIPLLYASVAYQVEGTPLIDPRLTDRADADVVPPLARASHPDEPQ